jgi:hypothetical protein
MIGIHLSEYISNITKTRIIEDLYFHQRKFRIIAIGENDTWYKYKELIGSVGKFQKNVFYGFLFFTEKNLELNFHESTTEINGFFFLDVTVEVL